VSTEPITQADRDALLELFVPLLTKWKREDIPEGRIFRFAEAYLMLAKENYRP
jgi:hypothetical protein